MPTSTLESLKIKAKLLQKAKRRSGVEMPLKEALDTLALAKGFGSWRDLKENLDATGDFCPPRSSAYWKTWYADYAEATAHLAEPGTYLMPYQRHFFVCDLHYVESLGVSREDRDLELVGRNWAEPADGEAWERLLKKIRSRPSHNET